MSESRNRNVQRLSKTLDTRLSVFLVEVSRVHSSEWKWEATLKVDDIV